MGSAYLMAMADRIEAKPPVVAPQQQHYTDRFRETFAILHNLAMWDLEDAGIISKGDDDKWKRFNNDLTTFVLKLDDARLDALFGLVEDRMPKRLKITKAAPPPVKKEQFVPYPGADFF